MFCEARLASAPMWECVGVRRREHRGWADRRHPSRRERVGGRRDGGRRGQGQRDAVQGQQAEEGRGEAAEGLSRAQFKHRGHIL
eukprot:3479930-Alexandrium_andersonii.AAC.1